MHIHRAICPCGRAIARMASARFVTLGAQPPTSGITPASSSGFSSCAARQRNFSVTPHYAEDFARPEDGEERRRSPRIPASGSRGARSPLPDGNTGMLVACSRASSGRLSPTSRRGYHRITRRRGPQGGALRVLGTGRAPIFPNRGCWAGLFRVAETLSRESKSAKAAADVLPRRAFFRRHRRRPPVALVASSTSISCARGQARRAHGWTTRSHPPARLFRVGTRVLYTVAFLTCNLSPPVEGRPPTFTQDESESTLFH
jgi:hypothetical protein